MEPADALAWFVGISSALGLLMSLRAYRFGQRGWLFVQAMVLLLVGMAVWLQSDGLLYVAFGCWLIFVKGPMFATQRQHELGLAYRFADAARWGRIAGLLHPFDGVPAQATYLLVQHEAHAGNVARAQELLDQLRRTPAFADVADVESWRLARNWRRIVQFVEQERAETWRADLAVPYVRALGELGEVSKMLLAYASLPSPIRQLSVLRLIVLAYCGRSDLLRELFAGPLKNFADAGREYWLAVAEQRSGDERAAAVRLERLLARGMLKRQVSERLLTPLAPLSEAALTLGARNVLAEIARGIAEAGSARGVVGPSRRPVATLVSIGILVVLFLVRFLDGWQDIDGLVRLGALVLPVEFTHGGADWRVVTAGLLHYNGTHLAMNSLALWVLGRDFERVWGPRLLIACLLGSSVGAYVLALYFMPASREDPKVLLGASAGVLGLVGALIVFSAVGYFWRDNRVLGQRLRMAGLIVAILLIFDAFTPIVSSFLHLAGLACGALIALPFSVRHFSRQIAR
ncbi:MAG: rhomboid family intramembrane serine protease [Myxococcota bacterium]